MDPCVARSVWSQILGYSPETLCESEQRAPQKWVAVGASSVITSYMRSLLWLEFQLSAITNLDIALPLQI